MDTREVWENPENNIYECEMFPRLYKNLWINENLLSIILANGCSTTGQYIFDVRFFNLVSTYLCDLFIYFFFLEAYIL